MNLDDAVVDWSSAPLDQLIGHLSAQHRQWVENVLPPLHDALEKKALEEPSDSAKALFRIFSRLCADLEAHLRNEENVLFPAILEMERCAQTGKPIPKPPFGSVRNPITMIEQDHQDDEHKWSSVLRLAQAADGAGEKHHPLYEHLTAFEAALREHTRLENTVLFPRALRLETQA
jgi:regulator of cell morphogenesis and NO signaling